MAGAQDQNDLRLRQEVNAPLTTVGAEMTYKQLDDNFIALFNLWNEMIGAINVQEYNAGVTYTADDQVKYDNHFWVYVSDIDQSGVTPGTDETVWLRATIGSLIGNQAEQKYVTSLVIKKEGNTDLSNPEEGDGLIKIKADGTFVVIQHDGTSFNDDKEFLSATV